MRKKEREREANKNDTAVHYLSINSPDLVMILVRSLPPPRTARRPPHARPSDRMAECLRVPNDQFQSVSIFAVRSVSDPTVHSDKLRSGCDMLGEFWAHIAYFWLA